MAWSNAVNSNVILYRKSLVACKKKLIDKESDNDSGVQVPQVQQCAQVNIKFSPSLFWSFRLENRIGHGNF
jgi:hypothetical protein